METGQTSRSTGPSPTRVGVVIIGAGMAGLSAAETLNQHGYTDLVILEASDRTGGRMFTRSFGHDAHSKVELGANFFEGTSMTNSAVVLSNQHNIMKISEENFISRNNGFFYRSDGRAIEKHISSKAWALFNGWLEFTPGADENKSLEEHVTQLFEETLASNTFKPSEESDVRCIFNYFRSFCELQYGDRIDQVGMGSLDEGHVDVQGGVMKVSGMNSVTDVLVRKLRSNQMWMRHEVVNVSVQGSVVKVACKNGAQFIADHVIVTVSLGFLKENVKSLFTPSLSRVKLEAIDKIGFGKVGKVFLYYNTPFWTRGDGRMNLAWVGGAQTMTSPREWYKAVEAIDEVLENDHVLVVWLVSDGIDAMEAADEEDIKKTCTLLIRKFLGNSTIPYPDKVLRTTWATDRLYRGAYAYRTKETRTRHYDDLAAPVVCDGKPRLLFAGEVILDIGCIQGARDTGISAAERILTSSGHTFSKL